MFAYYEEAEVCSAYLEDVVKVQTTPLFYDLSRMLRESRWFTRGWTLQELLAPRALIFLDHNWLNVGYRENWTKEIEAATIIKTEYLDNFRDCCVATKFSWARGRQTTRIEDRAYSLLGPLGINMPLLYGERENAFRRLQLEVIRNSDDESIFAWDSSIVPGSTG